MLIFSARSFVNAVPAIQAQWIGDLVHIIKKEEKSEMKLHGKKVLACLSLVLMVLSIVPSGALTNESSSQNATDIPDLAEGKFQGKGPMGKPAMEMPEFETEEEEMAFLKERAVESIEKRIEMAKKMLENIDEIDNENVTEESLEEEISELQALLDKINSATTLEELKELMSESMKMGKEGMKMGSEREMKGEKPEKEMPEFETEEEELEFVKEMMTNSTQMRIERTTSMIENIDEIDDENVTAESLEEELSELQALLDKINNATTLDELKELMSESMKMGEKGMKMSEGGKMRGMGPGMKMPEFETEEEELEFVKARTAESVERMVETLENTNLEETDSENITSEELEAILVQLEDIKTKLSSEDLTLEDIEEIRESMSGIMDSIREILPAPANERGPAPGHRGCQKEATA